MTLIKEDENIGYIYVVIPPEYVCIYYKLLIMLADYGEEMLKDCKASCTNRNSGIIECFNMFNSAIAAKNLGNEKLAETLIKYIKAKINNIYQTRDKSHKLVFPVDENGHLKAFVDCEDVPNFNGIEGCGNMTSINVIELLKRVKELEKVTTVPESPIACIYLQTSDDDDIRNDDYPIYIYDSDFETGNYIKTVINTLPIPIKVYIEVKRDKVSVVSNLFVLSKELSTETVDTYISTPILNSNASVSVNLSKIAN